MVRFAMIIILLLSLLTGISAVESKGTIVLDRDDSGVIGGNNQFAVDLYRALQVRPGNVSMSPASISTALALAYEGARSSTAEEMAKALHYPADRAAMREGFQALLARMNRDEPGCPYKLKAANSLWGQAGESFLPDYLRVVSNIYGGDLTSVNFRSDANDACRQINAWVDDKTEHLITQLISPRDVVPGTSLVLVNTLYFKGAWLSPFEKSLTTPADFHPASGSTVSVPTMRQTHPFRYAENKIEQILEMPYRGDDYAMLFVLPRQIDGLGVLEKSLSTERVAGWVKSLGTQRVAVELPKFKLTSRAELSKTLAALGMPTAFTPSADFSGITSRRDLFISAVVHQVVVNMDEEGTEAAAATGVMMARTAFRPMPIPVFRADHPFLYMIRDVKTGSILFIGRVVDPSV
jgi:serpin B